MQVEVLKNVFLSEYPELHFTSSLHPAQRTSLFGVMRIVDAHYCAEQFNTHIKPELEKKGIYTHASFVSGKMSKKDFDAEMNKWLKTGETTVMFSSEKLGEGADTVPVNMVGMLRPFGIGSEWKLKQFIGRGTRINPNSPEDDLLVFDGVFTSEKFNLASVFGIFKKEHVYNGGLLASREERVLLERKIFKYLSWGLKPSEVLLKLEEDEKVNALKWKILRDYEHSESSSWGVYERDGKILSIKFIERKDVSIFTRLENKRLLSEMTISGLAKEGFKTGKSILEFVRTSIQPFLKITIETVLVSEIIRLLTGKSITARGSDKQEILSSFIEVLKQYGFESIGDKRDTAEETQQVFGEKENLETISLQGSNLEVLEEKTDYLGMCINKCKQLFGLEPFVSVTERNGIFVSQMAIFAYGYQRFSPVCFALTKKEALRKVGKELATEIENDVASGVLLVYQDSKMYKQKLLLLEKVLRESSTSCNCESRFDEKIQMYFYNAYITKGKQKFSGKEVKHISPTRAEAWAKIALLDHLVKLFPLDEHVFVLNKKQEERAKFEDLIKTCGLECGVKSSSKNIAGVSGEVLWEAEVKILGLNNHTVVKVISYELFENNAIQKACSIAYDEFVKKGMEVTEQSAQVKPLSVKEISLYGQLNALKQKRSFKISYSTMVYLEGKWNIRLKITVTKDGQRVEFFSETYQGISKNEALDQCAEELLPQVKSYFGIDTE